MKCNKSISIFLAVVIGLVAGFLVNSYVPPFMNSGVQTYNNDIYSETGMSFNYPAEWHITGNRIFDDPYGTERTLLQLSPEPIVLTSPRGGPFVTQIEVSTVEMGVAFHAPYENLPEWRTLTTDELMIDGKKATRIRIVTDMSDGNIMFEIPFEEHVFVFGEKFGYQLDHYYTDTKDENEKAWRLLLETLDFE